METDIIEVKNGAAFGVKVKLENANFLLIKAEKGYLVCGYFDEKMVEKLKDTAVIISGVKTFNDMLKKKVSYVSKKAKKLRINNNMTGRQALEKLV